MPYHVAMREMDATFPALTTRGNRWLGLFLFACFAGPLVFAATLSPADAGMGTHTQIGLQECGFLLATGLPCATCGCTTAFAHAADGSLLSALLTQPFGALLALLFAVLALIAGWSVWSGMSMAPVGRMMTRRAMVLGWIGLLLAAWGYKAALVAAAW